MPAQSNQLQDICAARRRRLATECQQIPWAQCRQEAAQKPPPRGFVAQLCAAQRTSGWGLIAELKKASPSAGLLCPDYDPIHIAQTYTAAGATALSVLTEEDFFQGAQHHLTAAAAASPLPILRKDFILDPYQVAQTRAIGADCLLLILATLSDQESQQLATLAQNFDLDILVEIHDAQELIRAITLLRTLKSQNLTTRSQGILGINNRNLKTLTIDRAQGRRLLTAARSQDANIPVVIESGLRSLQDLQRFARLGATAFLVGESLLRADDLKKATRSLVATARPQPELPQAELPQAEPDSERIKA